MSQNGKERIKLKKQTGKRLCKFDLTQICLRSSPGILHSPLAVETTVLAVLVPLEPLDILESCRSLGNEKWIVLGCYYFPQHWWIPNPHVQWGEACACDNCDNSHSQMACALPSLSPFHSAPPKGQSSHRGPATMPRCHGATVTGDNHLTSWDAATLASSTCPPTNLARLHTAWHSTGLYPFEWQQDKRAMNRCFSIVRLSWRQSAQIIILRIFNPTQQT